MKKTSRIPGLAFAALLLGAISPALLATPSHTGIQGQAALYISYGTPVEVEPGFWLTVGDVMLPVTTSFSVLSAHSGHEVGRFATDASGAFTVSLPPGKYVVVPDPLNLFAAPFTQSVPTASFEVTVNPKEYAYALILYYQAGPWCLTCGQQP